MTVQYSEMFDRNIGVLSAEEQVAIKRKKVAIVGCGGMGGISAQIIARTGLQNIIVADPDKYEFVNINNQFDAFSNTIGKNKAKTVAKTLKEINPKIEIKIYPEGLTEKNVEDITLKADIIFDCIDYNELYYSYILNRFARKHSKFVLTPQAIGYGCSVLVFDPNGLSFNDFIGLREGMSKKEVNNILVSADKYAPIIPKYINQDIIEKVVLKKIPIPNIALAQTLAASIMVAEAIFILLNKREPVVIPNKIAVDLFEKKLLM